MQNIDNYTNRFLYIYCHSECVIFHNNIVLCKLAKLSVRKLAQLFENELTSCGIVQSNFHG